MRAFKYFALLGVLVLPTAVFGSTCDYRSINGTEFVFAEQPKHLQHYGYLLWQKTPQPPGRLPYDEYVGKRGKFTGKIVTDSTGVFKTYEAVTEGCEQLYLPTLDKPIPEIGMFQGIILLSDLADARALVGKTIFINKAAKAVAAIRPDDSGEKTLEIEQAEACAVDDVRAESFPMLVVHCKSKARGLLRYDKRYIWLQNPIDPKWNARTIGLIHAQKIAVGMTASQVKISWGEPEHVNETVGSWGKHEQWVYESNQYVYFENGRVTSMQTSH